MADKEAEATANDEIILYPEIKEDGNRMNYNIKYDVAMDFLSLPSRIESANGSVVEAISKLAPRVMTFKFEEKEEELLLV